jgi:hypothetical protein
VRALLVEIEPALKKREGVSLTAAMLFFGAINWTHTWYDAKGAVSPEALANMVVDMTVAGLARAAEG